MTLGRSLRSLLLIQLALALVSEAADPKPSPAPRPQPTAATLKNRPVLSLPLLERKLILAHHMTAWIGWSEGAAVGFNFNPVPGGADDALGTKSVAPMDGMVRRPKLVDLEAAVRHEIKSAKRMGLDGFQFFFPIHMHDGFLRRYSRIVKAFIRQAEKHQPDFRITLCLCAPGQPATEAAMREQWAAHIRWILDDTADSPIWLRSPDGRLIMYTWVPEGLVDPPAGGKRFHIHDRRGIAATAVAYERLARAIGEEIAFIFHMRGVDKDWYAHLIYDYFPGAWRWTEGDMSAAVPRLTDLARKRKRLFSPSVYPAFFGHTHRQNGDDPNGDGKVGRDPIEELWRPYHQTAQTSLYRNLLKSAVDADAQLISFITWNDITEATQLMPEVNYNFALGVLLNHYRNHWLGQPEKNEREIALVAYKKHRLDRPLPTDVGYRVAYGDDFGNLEAESRIEVVTILRAPAEIHVNGRRRGEVAAGLSSTLIPFEPGPIRVRIRRADRDIISLDPPEWATETPRRNDPVSVMYSSEFGRYFRDLYGPDAKPFQLREYAR
jgi:hypothetical protein